MIRLLLAAAIAMASAMAGTLVAEAAERQLPLFVLCDTLPRRIPRRTLRRFRTIHRSGAFG